MFDFFIERLNLYMKINPNELSSVQFKRLEEELKNKFKDNVISDEYLDFLLWMNSLPSRQESFDSFLSRKLNDKNLTKILEVGCGRTGRL